MRRSNLITTTGSFLKRLSTLVLQIGLFGEDYNMENPPTLRLPPYRLAKPMISMRKIETLRNHGVPLTPFLN